MSKIVNFNYLINQIVTTKPKEAILVILVGAILGYIFSKLNLPVPAPSVLVGVLGILGIWIGYCLGVK